MGKKILVVDDEPMLCEILRDFLEMDHFEVQQSCNGRQAFEMICKEHFDCVISDVRMPNGDGTELAQKIFAMDNPKPKVFLTTGFSEISEEQAAAIGVVKVLQKPFVYDQLLSSVRKVLVTRV